MTQVEAPAWTPMTAQEREAFDRDGYIVVPSVLSESEVEAGRAAILGAYENGKRNGTLGPTGALHQLSPIAGVPELAFLLDHPKAFKYIWSLLGWNIHVYHSHIDVHPQIHEKQKDWWHWHQDGGRQNREIETDPRPMLSVKLAYWFSDVSETGRGNFTVLPGSHKTNWLPGPPSRGVSWPQPEGATQITANAGDLVVFDRRIWHARSDNYSDITRVGAFFGYTPRWIAIRDEVADLPEKPFWNDLNPVQQQLLGGFGKGDGDHQWGHYPESTPLYGALKERGLLDSSIPALIP
ncbi:phytanoyl-CoA dioxygenase family protein [Actinoplanes sp. DH11]|uniref:phytanoyl-CoA dioxygenase family protein n=1 Tax=Actinoplanes sp. DH11 TaxID=2857011 RepID=UPI001E4F8EAE|nr:phytanoyl-CoA dioxygenase family protein [Actinoplanes sp. DH11]